MSEDNERFWLVWCPTSTPIVELSYGSALEIARRSAKAKPESYYSEPFQPHVWVLDAVKDAGSIRTSPRVRHTSKQSAIAEAKRLAAANPSHEFFVLEGVGKAKVTDPVAFVELTETEIPF